MPKTSITIQGLTFDVDLPYAEGHTVNQFEANALNQTWAENIRNNFASKVSKVLEAVEEQRGQGAELSEDELGILRGEFEKYAGEYKFQGRRGPGAPVDPVKREAIKIARETLRQLLSSNNQSLKDLKEGEAERIVELLIEQKPEIMETARQRVEQLKSIAGATLSLKDLQAAVAVPEAPAAEGEAAQAAQ